MVNKPTNVVQKSQLAKLLATENINVEFKQAKTAYFDLSSRTLVCPVWKQMSTALYDLIMGHEVGHALETPAAGWHDSIKDNKALKKFSSYLNILEDSRIEKKIKRRYPGLAKQFAIAYRELNDRDFFGIKALNSTDNLLLIDRINIRAKLGALVPTSFSNEEYVFVAESDNLETWEQVVDLAKRIHSYSKEQEQDKIKNMQDLQNALKEQNKQENGGDEESSDEDFEEDFDDDAENDGSEDSAPNDMELDDDSSASNKSRKSAPVESDETDSNAENDMQSVTDRVFRDREKELIGNGKINHYELPEPNLTNIVVPNLEIVDKFEAWLDKTLAESDHYRQYNIGADQIYINSLKHFKSRNDKFIQHMIQEFQMKKSAAEYNRQLTSKTGILDMNKIHNYKFTNDLFKKMSIVPKGKSHGMIMYLDMSSSMGNIFAETVEQLLAFISFCDKVNIPYEVYGFSDCYQNSTENTQNWLNVRKNNKLTPAYDNFKLLNLISSSLPRNQLIRAKKMLTIVSRYFKNSAYYYDRDSIRGWSLSPFSLGGTPLTQASLTSPAIVDAFREKYKIDLTNVVYLTDGESTDYNMVCFDSRTNSFNHFSLDRNADNYLVDAKTKKQYKMIAVGYSYYVTAVMDFVSQIVDATIIGIYILPKAYRITRAGLSNIASVMITDEQAKSYRKNNMLVVYKHGYSKYFIMNSPDIGNSESMDVNNKMTKNAMTKSFSKSQSNKKINRVLARKLMECIA